MFVIYVIGPYFDVLNRFLVEMGQLTSIRIERISCGIGPYFDVLNRFLVKMGHLTSIRTEWISCGIGPYFDLN